MYYIHTKNKVRNEKKNVSSSLIWTIQHCDTIALILLLFLMAARRSVPMDTATMNINQNSHGLPSHIVGLSVDGPIVNCPRPNPMFGCHVDFAALHVRCCACDTIWAPMVAAVDVTAILEIEKKINKEHFVKQTSTIRGVYTHMRTPYTHLRQMSIGLFNFCLIQKSLHYVWTAA